MNPRTRVSILSSCVMLLFLPAPFSLARAQAVTTSTPSSNNAPTQTPQPATRVKSGRAAAIDPLAEARRATAISLLNSLADEARAFHDETLRARVQARAADALWETDKERARALFRRAWDAADVADRESARRSEEERRAQMQRGGAMVFTAPRDLRGEVLRLAARRERALGEELLAKLDDARKQEREAAALKSDAPSPANPNAPANDGGSNAQRISLAMQLLQTSDTERAIQFAEPALRRVSSNVLRFLVALRQKDAKAADAIYAALLTNAAGDPATDANTVSLLSSYIFTPGLFIEIDRGGGYGVNNSGDIPAPDNISAQLRAAFFQFATQVLLRPLPPPDQDRTTSGRAGTYFMIARMLPLFEQHAPDKVPALQAQLTALTPDAPAQYRTEHPLLTKGLKPDSESQYDGVQSALDKLGAAKTSAERDGTYVEAAFAAEARNDPRAREFAEKIEDTETRRSLNAFLAYSEIQKALNKKEAEAVVRLAKTSDIPSIQRVWFYTEAARLLAKEDRTRAIEVLDEATTEMRRIEGAHADRARAMLAVATLLYELDRARTWTLMPDVVKTINSLSDFNGEDGQLVVKFQTRNMGAVKSGDAPNFNLQPLFALLARDDMDRAVEIVRTFNSEAPRAIATLAVAGAALKKQ